MRKIGGILALLLLTFGLATGPADPHPSSAEVSLSTIQGYVVDGSVLLTSARGSVVIPNDLPRVSGASIRVQAAGFESSLPTVEFQAVSDAFGRFAVPDMVVPEPYLKVNVEVSAPGFGTWSITGAPIRSNGNVLDLYVELLPHDQTITYVPREEQPAETGPRPSSPPVSRETQIRAPVPGAISDSSEPVVMNPTAVGSRGLVAQHNSGKKSVPTTGVDHGEGRTFLSTCSGYFSNDSPPPVIKVWRRSVGETFVRVYDFNFYVKHVLPSEWSASWHDNSLIAGAVAVENYGWYWVNNWRGWAVGVPASGECYDVDDTISYQVFNPGLSHPRTDNAVNTAWNWIAKKFGVVFEGRYWSG